MLKTLQASNGRPSIYITPCVNVIQLFFLACTSHGLPKYIIVKVADELLFCRDYV